MKRLQKNTQSSNQRQKIAYSSLVCFAKRRQCRRFLGSSYSSQAWLTLANTKNLWPRGKYPSLGVQGKFYISQISTVQCIHIPKSLLLKDTFPPLCLNWFISILHPCSIFPNWKEVTIPNSLDEHTEIPWFSAFQSWTNNGKVEYKPRAMLTCSGVNATLEAVPEERSRMVDFPPYTMLCFWSVRWWGQKGCIWGFSMY